MKGLAMKVDKQSKPKKQRNFNGVVGILLLFVVASIAYSTYVVALGTEGYIPKVMLLPQAAWVVVELIKRFTK